MDTRSYDVVAMGRSSIDLYSNDIGAPFVDISSFAAYVGGSPRTSALARGVWACGPHSSPRSEKTRWATSSCIFCGKKE